MTKGLQKLLFLAGTCAAFLAPATTEAQTYCAASNDYGCYYRMMSFSTSGGTTNISHPSVSCTNQFSTNPVMTHTTSSHTGMLNTVVNFTAQNYTWMYNTIWVDWNQDGDFTDAGENVYSSPWTNYTTFGSFTIPATASIGTTTMRVRTHWFVSTASSCGAMWDYGNVVDYSFNVTSPCASVAAAGIVPTAYSKSAMINWNAAPGAVSYDYRFTLASSPNSTAIASGNTTATSATATGLTPTTNYWIHIKNRCAVYPAGWTSKMFTTSSCAPPVPSFANITHNSALALWSSVSVANKYEYLVTTDPNPPGTGVTLNTTSSSSIQLTNLDPVTTYYVHIRSVCGTMTSEWDVASFTTMSECEAPTVDIIKTGANDIEASWQPVETAVAYEYAINSSVEPPALGTTVYNAMVKFNIPDDKKAYYFHIRSKCISIFNTSEWSTEQLREADPTAISNINGEVLVQAYPNPVNNIVTVQIDGLEQVNGAIAITDITGKVVLTTAANSSKTNINMSNLAPGAYFIKYSDGNHTKTFRVNKL